MKRIPHRKQFSERLVNKEVDSEPEFEMNPEVLMGCCSQQDVVGMFGVSSKSKSWIEAFDDLVHVWRVRL